MADEEEVDAEQQDRPDGYSKPEQLSREEVEGAGGQYREDDRKCAQPRFAFPRWKQSDDDVVQAREDSLSVELRQKVLLSLLATANVKASSCQRPFPSRRKNDRTAVRAISSRGVPRDDNVSSGSRLLLAGGEVLGRAATIRSSHGVAIAASAPSATGGIRSNARSGGACGAFRRPQARPWSHVAAHASYDGAGTAARHIGMTPPRE